MKSKFRLESGYTLTEGLSVLAIAGFALMISIPQTLSFLSDYKLKVATQQVATALQFTRSKAVSQNFNCTYTNLTSDSINKFQITGGEDDHDDGLHPWEDRNGNGIEDSLTMLPQDLPAGVKVLGTLVSAAPVPVTGNPTTSATSLTFNSLGVPNLVANAAAIYLENGNRDRTAVTVDLSGRVQAWKQSGSFWVAL
jgi:Tfp pilus assembly protein FimT